MYKIVYKDSHIIALVDLYKKKTKFYNGTSKSRYYASTILATASNVLKSITNRDSKWLLGKYLRTEASIPVLWPKNQEL